MKNDSFRSEIKNTVLGHDNTIVNILLQQLNSNISSRLIAEEEYINKNEERTKRIVELFEKFLFEYKNALDKPTIRCYGLFSDLAMVDNILSDHSDRALLLSEEKESFIKSIQNNFPIRQIVSLDVNFIIDVRGYSMEKFENRSEELIGEIRSFEQAPNFEIVFDYKHRNRNTFIFGTDLMIDAIEIEKQSGYTTTLFTNDKNKISKRIQEFDNWFSELHREREIIKKYLTTSDVSVVCEQLLRIRKNQYLDPK